MPRSLRLGAILDLAATAAAAVGGGGRAAFGDAVRSSCLPTVCRPLIGAPAHPAASAAAAAAAAVGCRGPTRGLFGFGSAPPVSAGGGAPDDAAVRSAEKMVELMAGSPQMQQLLAASLPPGARDPETVQALLRDPGMKQKLVDMIAKQVGFGAAAAAARARVWAMH
eukprot:366551-Chlamydomonas_euryale.AAC.28